MINILNNQLKFKEKQLMLHKLPAIDPKKFTQILKKRKNKICKFSYTFNYATPSMQITKSLSLILKSLPSTLKQMEIKEKDKNFSCLSQKGFDYLNELAKLNKSFLYPKKELKIKTSSSSLLNSSSLAIPSSHQYISKSSRLINMSRNPSLIIKGESYGGLGANARNVIRPRAGIQVLGGGTAGFSSNSIFGTSLLINLVSFRTFSSNSINLDKGIKKPKSQNIKTLRELSPSNERLKEGIREAKFEHKPSPLFPVSHESPSPSRISPQKLEQSKSIKALVQAAKETSFNEKMSQNLNKDILLSERLKNRYNINARERNLKELEENFANPLASVVTEKMPSLKPKSQRVNLSSSVAKNNNNLRTAGATSIPIKPSYLNISSQSLPPHTFPLSPNKSANAKRVHGIWVKRDTAKVEELTFRKKGYAGNSTRPNWIKGAVNVREAYSLDINFKNKPSSNLEKKDLQTLKQVSIGDLSQTEIKTETLRKKNSIPGPRDWGTFVPTSRDWGTMHPDIQKDVQRDKELFARSPNNSSKRFSLKRRVEEREGNYKPGHSLRNKEGLGRLDFRKRIEKNESDLPFAQRGDDKNSKDNKKNPNLYLSRFRGSIDWQENSKKGNKIRRYYENQNDRPYLKTSRMRNSQINNILKTWKISRLKKKIFFDKLGNYAFASSDLTFLNNISNIRKIIDSKYTFDLFLSSSQSINYSFNKNNNKNKTIDLKSLYKFLKYAFSSLSAFISKPVYSYSPEKICISLFYFIIPKMNILKKERKLKFLIRKKSDSVKDQKHKNVFNKIMTKFKIKEFLANWKENNNMVRLPILPDSNILIIDQEDNQKVMSIQPAEIQLYFKDIKNSNNSKPELLDGPSSGTPYFTDKENIPSLSPLARRFNGKKEEDREGLRNVKYSKLSHEVIFNCLLKTQVPQAEFGLGKEIEKTDNISIINTLFNLNNGQLTDLNVLQFRANQLAQLILSTIHMPFSDEQTKTMTEKAKPVISNFSEAKHLSTFDKLDKGDGQVKGPESQGGDTGLLLPGSDSSETRASIGISSNLSQFGPEEQISYLISKLDSSAISYLFNYITKSYQYSPTLYNLPHNNDLDLVRTWVQELMSNSLKTELRIENPLIPLASEHFTLKEQTLPQSISDISESEKSPSAFSSLDTINHSHIPTERRAPICEKPISTFGPEIELLASEENSVDNLIRGKEEISSNLKKGFENLDLEISSDFLTSLGKLSTKSSLLKLADKDIFKNGFNSLQLLKFRETSTMISLNDKMSQYLVSNLENLFDKEVEVDLTRIKYPYHDSNILSQILKISSYKKTFRYMMKRLLYTAIINNPTNLIRKQDFSIIPSYLSGIKVRLAGRISTQRVIPRFTVQSFQMGSLARGKVNYVETSRITHKNKRGAFSFTVTTSHFFENKKNKKHEE